MPASRAPEPRAGVYKRGSCMASADTGFEKVEVQVVTFSMQQSQLALGDVLSRMPKTGDVIIMGIEQAEEDQLKYYLAKINPFMKRAEYEYEYHKTKNKLAVFVYKKTTAKPFNFTEFSPAPAPKTGLFTASKAKTSEIILEMKLDENQTPFFFVVTDCSEKQTDLTTYIAELQKKFQAQNLGTAFCICGDFSDSNAVKKSKTDLKLDEDDYFLKCTLPKYRVQIKNQECENLPNVNTPESITDRILFCMTNSYKMMIKVNHMASGVVECQNHENWTAGAGSKHYAVYERFELCFAKWSEDENRTNQDVKADHEDFQEWSRTQHSNPHKNPTSLNQQQYGHPPQNTPVDYYSSEPILIKNGNQQHSEQGSYTSYHGTPTQQFPVQSVPNTPYDWKIQPSHYAYVP